MVKAVSAYQDGLTRIYTNDDGSTTVLRGGTRAWRNNNPGNIKYGANAKAAGAIGADDNGFAIFPNYQSGRQGIANVFTRKYGSSTIDQAMQGYAPPTENDTAGYIASLKDRGIPGDTLIRDFTPEQLNRLGDGIRDHEGWHAGTVTGAAANMGGPEPSVVVQRAGSQASPFQQSQAPVPYLAQTQAADPAFDGTNWLQRPTSPNVLRPDAAPPFAPSVGAPRVAPTSFVDGTMKAQQALDNSLPGPGAAPWDRSDRFGTWDTIDGVSGPVRSGGSGGPGQTGDVGPAGLGGATPVRFAAAGDASGPAPRSNDVASPSPSNIDRASVRRLSSPMLDNLRGGPNPPPFDTDPMPYASLPWLPLPPTGQSPFDLLLAPERNRAPGDWVQPLPFRPTPTLTQNAPGGIPGLMKQLGAFDPSNPDQPPAGGLLRLIQDYMRDNPDGSATI